MATGARDRQAQESLRGRIDTFIDGVVVVIETLANGDEAEGGEPGIVLGEVRQTVGRQLLDDELVVRLIAVQGFDNVVAVGPSTREAFAFDITAVAARVGIAGSVEPVTGPALTVARRSQQPVDRALDHQGSGPGGLAITHRVDIAGDRRIVITSERIGLRRGRRHAMQVIGQAAQQGIAIGGRVRL